MSFIAINLQYLLFSVVEMMETSLHGRKKISPESIKNCLWSFNFIYNFHSWHFFSLPHFHVYRHRKETSLIRRWKAKHEDETLAVYIDNYLLHRAMRKWDENPGCWLKCVSRNFISKHLSKSLSSFVEAENQMNFPCGKVERKVYIKS